MNEIKKKKYNGYDEVAILAKQQTNGRGRRNNNWISIKEIYFYLLRFKKKVEKIII